MAKQKIRAGLYTVATKHGTFFIRNTGPHRWVITNTSHRRIGSPFTTLALANEFLTGLNIAPASERAKSYLRTLLDRHAGAPEAEQIRAYFNQLRQANALISAHEVSRAITRLTEGPKRPLALVPSQKNAEPVLPAAEAKVMARQALAQGPRFPLVWQAS